MNKARRQELTKLKFKKRLNNLSLKQNDPKDYILFKHQAKPCSCSMCSPKSEKYKYLMIGKQKEREINQEIISYCID